MAPLRRVVPAILTDDPKSLETMLRQAEGFTGWVQFDIMDGLFVPSHSIDSRAIAAVKPKLGWEAHLMVQKPENFIKGFKSAGAKKIIFHYEAVLCPPDMVASIKSLGLKAGIALNPDTPVSVITEPLAAELDSVLFLSVYPGFYGRPFVPQVLDKIRDFRRKFPGLTVGIDGGIKEANIAEVAGAGADEICVGSAIFAQPNPAESYKRLVELAEEEWGASD